MRPAARRAAEGGCSRGTRGRLTVRHGVRHLEGGAAGNRAAVVHARADLERGAGRGDAAQAEAVRGTLRVDLGDVARAGGALVADVVGELFAVLVTVAAEDARVVASDERDGRPAAGESAAGPVAQRRVVALDDARCVVDARGAVA